MSNPKQLVLSLRFVPNPLVPSWHAALIVDRQMDEVFVGTLDQCINRAADKLLKGNFPVGTRLVATFDIAEPEEQNAANPGN